MTQKNHHELYVALVAICAIVLIALFVAGTFNPTGAAAGGNRPTKCGNQVCNKGETTASCTADCACATGGSGAKTWLGNQACCSGLYNSNGVCCPTNTVWNSQLQSCEAPVIPPSDSTPPVLSNGAPTGQLPGGTTSATLSVNTNENAVCKYSTIPGTPYSSMTITLATSGGQTHTASISGLANGQSYNYYVRCMDSANNVNTNDYTVSFSIAQGCMDTTWSPSTAGLCGSVTQTSNCGTTRTAQGSVTCQSGQTCTRNQCASNSTQTPYAGTPGTVPGTIQAENFDNGGEGVAYHDNVAGNSGGLYRTIDSVDIITSRDAQGGAYVLSNFETGEWTEYTISVAQTAQYRIDIRASNAGFTPAFKVEIDGTDVTGTITIPDTGSWSTFTNAGKNGVTLTQGTHVLRLYALQQYADINLISITAAACVDTTWTPSTASLCGTVQQTSNCGNTRTIQGGLSCQSGYTCTNNACIRNPATCGNGLCEAGETASSCPADCQTTSPPAGIVLAELPRATVDTTMPTQPATGTTWNIPGGDSAGFQNALNNAKLGDTIVLQAGATYTGNFILPEKTTGSGWIVIQSSKMSSLPAAGVRVKPSDAANMPKLVTGVENGPVLRVANRAHHYRVMGVELTSVPSVYQANLIMVGERPTALADITHHVVFDRVYAHGTFSYPIRRAFSVDGGNIAVINSYLAEIGDYFDAQAISGYTGPGPIKIENNFLQASGEVINFGGGTQTLPGVTQADIEIRNNYITKNLAWQPLTQGPFNVGWDEKNLIEFKHANHVLIEGNVLEHSWRGGQEGFAFVFWTSDQDGMSDWVKTGDLTIRYNRINHAGGGMNLIAHGDRPSNYPVERVTFEQNILTNIGATDLENPVPKLIQLQRGLKDVVIRQNTGFSPYATLYVLPYDEKMSNIHVYNNIMGNSPYNIWGQGTSGATALIAAMGTTDTVKNNVIVGAVTPTVANNQYPATVADVGFANYPADLRLATTSPYKGYGSGNVDPGANIDEVNFRTRGAISGVWN